MNVVQTREELAAARKALPGRVAVVMTMGALHEGHATLVREARALADSVVVTIFVNPLQFGANEDLDRYPRTLEADLEVCEREGADLVFTPTPDVVYPDQQVVTVSAGSIGEGTWVRFHLRTAHGSVKAALFQAYGCPHTLAVTAWLTEQLAGRAIEQGVPGTPAAWLEALEVPVEKLGRLLLVEDALQAALQHPL